MSFSLRWLFTVVAIAAVFAAAFTFQSDWWATATVTITLIGLVAVLVGVYLKVLPQPFWKAFCVVGWLYVVIAFADGTTTRLPMTLPTTRAAFEIWRYTNQERSILSDLDGDPDGYDAYQLFAVGYPSATKDVVAFYYFLDMVHSLFTLVLATLAGVIASYCVRRSKLLEHQ